jgi:hypothetical protein
MWFLLIICSRLVILSEMLPNLKMGCRVAIWGMPGNNQKPLSEGNVKLDDLNAEKSYEPDFGFVHLNTVMVNEVHVYSLGSSP